MTTAILMLLLAVWALFLANALIAGQTGDGRMFPSGLWLVVWPVILMVIGAIAVLSSGNPLLSLITDFWWFPVAIQVLIGVFVIVGVAVERFKGVPSCPSTSTSPSE